MKKNIHYAIIGNKPHNSTILFKKINDCKDFLTLFASILYINHENYFRLNYLISFIDECRQNNKYFNLLNSVYSVDNLYDCFEKAIKVLKMEKDITEFRYQFGNIDLYAQVIIINKHINLKQAIINNNKDKIIEMNNFVKDYYNYLNKDFHINNNKKSVKVQVRRLRQAENVM